MTTFRVYQKNVIDYYAVSDMVHVSIGEAQTEIDMLIQTGKISEKPLQIGQSLENGRYASIESPIIYFSN